MPLPRGALIILSLCFLPISVQGETNSSLSPPAGAHGERISVTGGPFPDKTEVLLGETVLHPERGPSGELTFVVPPVPAGNYVLRLRAPGGKELSSLGFRVVPSTPRLLSLAPATVDACALLQGQQVVLTGEFPAQAQVLLDGAVIPTERSGKSEIVFALPPLEIGMHQVEVAVGDAGRSVPHALFVNGVPEIVSVWEGEDFVTGYEVVVSGRNFLFTSVLAVNGAPLHPSLWGDTERNFTAVQLLGGEDYVRYIDCERLVYVRHPVIREPETVTLQVINPDASQSDVYVVEIP